MPDKSSLLSPSHISHQHINLIMPLKLPCPQYHYAPENVHLEKELYLPVLGLINAAPLTVIFKTTKSIEYKTSLQPAKNTQNTGDSIKTTLLRPMIAFRWFITSRHYHPIDALMTDNSNTNKGAPWVLLFRESVVRAGAKRKGIMKTVNKGRTSVGRQAESLTLELK